MEQEEKLCNGVETVREFPYLRDMVSAGGGCEAAVTAKARCEWVKLRECGELLYGRKFPLKLRGAVYKYYVRTSVLYGSEAWCLRGSEMGILRKTERFMARAMFGAQFNDIKRYKDLMLGLNTTKDQ